MTLGINALTSALWFHFGDFSSSSVSDDPDNSCAQSRLLLHYEKRPTKMPEGFDLDVDNFKRFMTVSDDEYLRSSRDLQLECDDGITFSEQARRVSHRLGTSDLR